MSKAKDSASSVEATNNAPATQAFTPGEEYTYALRSFRISNGFMFVSTGKDLQILIGNASDYKLETMLLVKQMQGNVYATFKEWRTVNNVRYPAFTNVTVG
jgi:hypothetical protein